MSAHGQDFCYEHQQVCAAEVPTFRVHVRLTGGVSCKPYSTSSAQRLTKGTVQHEEAHLYECFIEEMLRIDADEGWLENVLGVACRESNNSPKSPLQSMVEMS